MGVLLILYRFKDKIWCDIEAEKHEARCRPIQDYRAEIRKVVQADCFNELQGKDGER